MVLALPAVCRSLSLYYTVGAELDKERSKEDDGATAWMDKSHQLEQQVDMEKDRADKLDRINQAQGRENQRLKQQFQTTEDDRDFLVKQLIVVKRENEALRKKLAEHDADLQTVRSAMGASGPSLSSASWDPASAGGGSAATRGGVPSYYTTLPRQEADSRYKDIVNRLTKMLQIERRHSKQVRAAPPACRGRAVSVPSLTRMNASL